MLTSTKVRSSLTTVLDGLLGEYTRPDGSKTPAVWVGPVPSDYRITRGVEVRIPADAELGASPLHNNEVSITGSIPVRAVAHGQESLQEVATRILLVYPLTQTRYVPGDPTSGVLNQAVFHIPIR